MEVYNDYNSNLTNLFFCVKERPLALITELGFLPLNSRDDYDAIYRQLKCEEFDDEYLAIELERADKYLAHI
jgi:DNA adenine methylase